MTTVLGVSIGTGAVVLSFVAAKTSLFEKIYGFVKEHLFKKSGGHTFTNIGGDAAGRDINKKWDQRHRAGDVYQTASSQIARRSNRIKFFPSDPELADRLAAAWDRRGATGGSFDDYLDVLLESKEFSAFIKEEEMRFAERGWRLESVEDFDNTSNSAGKNGVTCSLRFSRPLARGQ
jgi:hypothetical protein